ncbi:MAG: hypothetical protein PHV74_05320, partial [Dehalococcoidia bacterium]|nr:hypothetical protein [Dehalococcoidia bacterium]
MHSPRLAAGNWDAHRLTVGVGCDDINRSALRVIGRMSDPRACWAPSPKRPKVGLELVREFRYEYAAVSPWDGTL